MANRVTSDEVKEIINTSLTDIDAFITAANILVTYHLASETDMTTDLLKETERWLSAHFVAIRDPKIKSESVDGAAASYESGQLGMSLKFTSYGQQALLFDVTGKLSSIGKKKAVIETIDFEDV